MWKDFSARWSRRLLLSAIVQPNDSTESNLVHLFSVSCWKLFPLTKGFSDLLLLLALDIFMDPLFVIQYGNKIKSSFPLFLPFISIYSGIKRKRSATMIPWHSCSRCILKIHYKSSRRSNVFDCTGALTNLGQSVKLYCQGSISFDNDGDDDERWLAGLIPFRFTRMIHFKLSK